MSLQKISLAGLVLLALTACGGGGSGTPNTASTPTQNTENTDSSSSNNNGNSSTDSGNSSTDNSSTSPVNPVQTVSDATVKATKTLSVATLKSINNAALLEEFSEDGFKAIDTYQVSVGGKSYSSGNINLSALGNDLQRLNAQEVATSKINGSTYTATVNSVANLYQQPYSVVAGLVVQNGRISGPGMNETASVDDTLDIDLIKGYATKVLPIAGKATYTGVAFTEDEQGTLSYNVDFSAQTGSGSISGISQAGTITLSEGTIGNISHTNSDNTTINGFGIEAGATSASLGSGSYKLGFFGPNAEEVAGAVIRGSEAPLGFGGTRGDITP